MRLNNKGFAISSILYSILIMAIMLILGVLFSLFNRKIIFDKLKHDVLNQLDSNMNMSIATITVNPVLSEITSDPGYNILSGVTASETKNGITTDLTNNIIYHIYDASGNDVTNGFTAIDAGRYTIKYDVMDSNNNLAETKSRILIVNDIILDRSGNNYNGTLKNGASLIGGGLTLDGVDDYVELTTLPNTINWKDGITIEFSAKWDNNLKWSRIFDFSNGQASNNILVANSSTSDTIVAVSQIDTNIGTFNIGTTSNSRTDYKIVIARNGTNYNIVSYVNGVQVNSTTTADNSFFNNVTRTVNYIGRSAWSYDAYFDGTIYKLMIKQINGNKIIDFDFTS